MMSLLDNIAARAAQPELHRAWWQIQKVIEADSQLVFPSPDSPVDPTSHGNYNTGIAAAVEVCHASAFMEVGVWHGSGLCMASFANPDIQLLGFDIWQKDYGGKPTPNPEIVRKHLTACGHKGSVEFVTGDSKQTVPLYRRDHPERRFAVIGVDGSHDPQDALYDLLNCLPLLESGGIIIFDDLVQLPWAYATLIPIWTLVAQTYPHLELPHCDQHACNSWGILQKVLL